jgi:hypothetical protein
MSVTKREVQMTVSAIVKEHLKASRKVRKSFQESPENARQFLIRAGILNKKGTGLSARYR